MCILFNPKINIKIKHVTDIFSGRIQACKVNLENIFVTIVNLWTIITFLLEHNDQTLIIRGNFNTPLNRTIDKQNSRLNTNKTAEIKINQIIQTNDLIDIRRECHKIRKQFTWHSNTKPVLHSKLDYFLISNKIRNVMKSCNIKNGFKTDHVIVLLNIESPAVPMGPGYFKINNSILIDNDYQTKIKQTISNTVNENKECNPNTLWEVIKGNMRNETIKYSTLKKTNKTKRNGNKK